MENRLLKLPLLLFAVLFFSSCKDTTTSINILPIDKTQPTPVAIMPKPGSQFTFHDEWIVDSTGKVDSSIGGGDRQLVAIDTAAFLIGRDRVVRFQGIGQNTMFIQYRTDGDAALWRGNSWLDLPVTTHVNYERVVMDSLTFDFHDVQVNKATWLGAGTIKIKGKTYPTSRIETTETDTLDATGQARQVSTTKMQFDWAPTLGFYAASTYHTSNFSETERSTLVDFVE